MAERPRILIVGDDFTPAEVLAQAIRAYAQAALDLRTVDLRDPWYRVGPEEGVREFLGSPEDVLPHVEDVHVLVTTFAPITRRVLDAALSLRLIVSGRGGPVNIDVEAATARRIPVAFARGRNSEAVAEFVLGLLVALPRRFAAAERHLRTGAWTDGREDTFAKPSGPELEGRVLGIVGLGAVGARVAELVRPLRMRVLAHDPFVEDGPLAAVGAERAELERLLAKADYVTIHVRPANGESVIGERELARMKPGAFLINTSRAVNVDHAALVAALESGRLAGAALDVFPTEPLPPNDPILRCDNVLLTPHSAGVSLDVPTRTAHSVAEAVATWLAGGVPANVRKPEALGSVDSRLWRGGSERRS
jgi:D-3-phosphoglycerate dehydrogenase